MTQGASGGSAGRPESLSPAYGESTGCGSTGKSKLTFWGTGWNAGIEQKEWHGRSTFAWSLGVGSGILRNAVGNAVCWHTDTESDLEWSNGVLCSTFDFVAIERLRREWLAVKKSRIHPRNQRGALEGILMKEGEKKPGHRVWGPPSQDGSTVGDFLSLSATRNLPLLPFRKTMEECCQTRQATRQDLSKIQSLLRQGFQSQSRHQGRQCKRQS